MRHAHVVFDNDAPLFVCYTQEQAEAVMEQERERLRRNLLGYLDDYASLQMLSPTQLAAERTKAEEALDRHYLHYHLVPFAPTPTRSARSPAAKPQRRSNGP